MGLDTRLNFDLSCIFLLMMDVKLMFECVFGSRWVLCLLKLWVG